MSKTVFLTGATDGLGRALAVGLAGEGVQLILHGRNRERLDRLAAEIVELGAGPPPSTVLADLADLAQVRDLSAQVAALTDHLDVFVSNAGIGGGEPDGRDRRVSVDGFELRFAVNYLAGFDLTMRLLPLLTTGGAARIVYVASLGQRPIDFDDPMIERDYSGDRAYAQSKLAQITSGFELADRLPANVVAVNSLHPATYMPTKMVLTESGHSIDTLETGEAATRRLATAPELGGITGRFFNQTRDVRANPVAYDPEVRARLWQLSLDLTGAPDFPG